MNTDILTARLRLVLGNREEALAPLAAAEAVPQAAKK